MRVFDALRAMNAFVGNDSGGVAEDALCALADGDEVHEAHEAAAAVVTCHKCGAVVDAGTREQQTDSGGGPMLSEWYCRAHLVAGTEWLLAAIRAQRGQRREGGAE